MELIKIVNEFLLLARKKLLHVFSFWFEEYVIYLHKNYKHLIKLIEEKTYETSKEMYLKIQELY